MQQRQTKQRLVIESILKASDTPLLPKEILARAKQKLPQLGIATVFRTLKKLVDDGQANIVHLPGDSPRYVRADLGHHHHFKCDGCDRVYDIDDCPGHFENMLPEGFQLTGHDVTLYGRCSGCA